MYTTLILIAVFISGLILGSCTTLMLLRFVSSTRKSMKRNKPLKIHNTGYEAEKEKLRKVI